MFSPKWPAQIPPFFSPHVPSCCFCTDYIQSLLCLSVFISYLSSLPNPILNFPRPPQILITCKSTGTNQCSISKILACVVLHLYFVNHALNVFLFLFCTHPQVIFIICMCKFAWLNLYFMMQKCLPSFSLWIHNWTPQIFFRSILAVNSGPQVFF